MTTTELIHPRKKPAPLPLPALHRIVLDWLAKQPARVFDFVEVAEGAGLKRAQTEHVLADLRHQKYGAILSLMAPDGLKLRPRHAYLPAKSHARAGYAPVAEADATAAEHPTVIAHRAALTAHHATQARLAAERAEQQAERGQAIGTYRKRQLDARAKAAAARAELPDRYVTGMAVPLGAASNVAPKAPSSKLAAKEPPPAPAGEPETAAPTPPPEEVGVTYKKKGTK